MRSLIVGLIGLAGPVALAQMTPSSQAAVEAYRNAINAAESGRAAGAGPNANGVEAAFSALAPLRNALTGLRENGTTVLESLPEAEFERLQRDLRGAVVNRDETIFVEPDPDYFARLAAAHGDSADRSFFAALKATYPGPGWPTYLEQQTDYSGCTRFGSGSLVQAYAAWSEFRSKFPGRYVTVARAEADRVGKELTESTCACGDASSVAREIDQFLRRFPDSPLQVRLRARLQALGAGRSGIRFRCQSG